MTELKMAIADMESLIDEAWFCGDIPSDEMVARHLALKEELAIRQALQELRL